jgi:hypothetical protein
MVTMQSSATSRMAAMRASVARKAASVRWWAIISLFDDGGIGFPESLSLAGPGSK